MKQYDLSVFIGRLQPCHLGHFETIYKALERSQHLLILIGSANRARSIRNPWTYEERVQMLEIQIDRRLLDRITIAPLNDYYYDESGWCLEVCSHVAMLEKAHSFKKVAIIGHMKDNSTYYLKSFPEWDWVSLPCHASLHATDIRAAMFEKKMLFPNPVYRLENAAYERLRLEYFYVKQYKAQNQALTQYPILYQTVDSVVICLDHILLIQRKNPPGQTLWGLPGGYLEEKEWIETGLIRELKEETSLDVEDTILKSSLVERRVFDHPDRSVMGRVVTHGGYYHLKRVTRLPSICAGDDAQEARWVKVEDFWGMARVLHDDHYLIVKHFLRSGLF